MGDSALTATSGQDNSMRGCSMGAIQGKKVLGVMAGENFYCRHHITSEVLKAKPKQSDYVTDYDIKEEEQSFICDTCGRIFDAETIED